jgi:hypothetical protein
MTTVTVGGGGTRGNSPVALQPAAPSTTVAVKDAQDGRRRSLAVNLGCASRFGIMAVLLQQIAK